MPTRALQPLYVERCHGAVTVTYAVQRIVELAGPRVALAVVDPPAEEPETGLPAVLFQDRVALDSLASREKYAATAAARANGSAILAAVCADDLAAMLPQVRAWAEPSTNGRTPEPATRPVLDTADGDLERASAHCWEALLAANEPPRLFVYGGNVSRIERDPDTGAPVPRDLNVSRLRFHVARAASFIDQEGQPVAPPVDWVADLLADPAPPLPLLRGLVEIPAFGPDGSLATEPGYHPASGTVYAPPPGFVVPPIPEAPTSAHIEAARELIATDVLGDFPFTSQAAKAHAFGLTLLPAARYLIAGPTPLHLVSKPMPGTGGSLLADTLAQLATGRPAAAMTIGASEDETRKHITSALLDSPTFMFIDNLGRRLDSASLAAVLTTGRWQDRILGSSTVVRLAVRCCWVCSANNPRLSSELTRRSISLGLDAKMEQPWTRTDFRHPDLPGWVAAHRGELVASILTLVRAWLVAGQPPPPAGAKPLGGFERWSYVMGGILHLINVPGFLANLSELYAAADEEGRDVREFLWVWWDKHEANEVPISDLFTLATAANSTLDLVAKSEQGQKVRLGRLLSSIEGRKYKLGADLTVTVGRAERGAHGGGVLWRLAADTWDAGSRGESAVDVGDSGRDSRNTESPSESAQSCEKLARW
jgi:putative DNA primase/helicase